MTTVMQFVPKAKELGIVPDDATAFDDVDGLMTFLEGE